MMKATGTKKTTSENQKLEKLTREPLG